MAENKDTAPLEVTVEILERLPRFYREVGFQYLDEGKIILKKPEEEKT